MNHRFKGHFQEHWQKLLLLPFIASCAAAIWIGVLPSIVLSLLTVATPILVVAFAGISKSTHKWAKRLRWFAWPIMRDNTYRALAKSRVNAFSEMSLMIWLELGPAQEIYIEQGFVAFLLNLKAQIESASSIINLATTGIARDRAKLSNKPQAQ